MEALRRTIDSSLLDGIITLPMNFRNKTLELTVRVADGNIPPINLTLAELDAMMPGSFTESITGILPDAGMTLEDYRAERLMKHECID